MKKHIIASLVIIAVAAAAIIQGCGGGGGAVPLKPEMEPNPSIQLNSVPARSAIYIDGQRQAASPNNLFVVEPGDHTIVIQKVGYTQTSPSATGTITVEKCKTTQVTVALTPVTPPALPNP